MTSISERQHDRRLPVEHGSTHPRFSGVAFNSSADGFVVNLTHHAENDWPSFFIGCRSRGM
ncbi:hypothetical protein [Rhizobium sp. GN54]|uniref:hypothetical protein n=1 Tax=Rhizobium sp. GN54 TaxID=2898150 RepID=UPI001E3B7F64|nr:hypothetical protein [Rhizobium sp. GN54]MCD2184866.1 hypothetical protein [Rhizobium sp. GN54]